MVRMHDAPGLGTSSSLAGGTLLPVVPIESLVTKYPANEGTTMQGKRCYRCGETKPRDQFHRDRWRKGGLDNRCRECERARDRKRRAENSEAFRKKQERYSRTEKGRRVAAAHAVVVAALASGRLVRPESCKDCGATGRIEGHHPDYDKPLEVDWLCVLCHNARHKEAA